MDYRRLGASVERAIATANNTGKLQWFNRAYVKHRQRNGNLTYRAARVRLRDAIVRRLMRRQPWNPANLIPEIFGAASPGRRPPMR